jgi:hypothetical protein
MADLTAADYAFLILLQIENTTISNAAMQERYGVRLIGGSCARLRDAQLIETEKLGSMYHHTLKPAGTKVLTVPLKADAPKSEKEVWAALAALHTSRLDDRKAAPAAEPEVDPRPAEDQIRGAYAGLATERGAWVSLTRLRAALPGLPKDDIDKALVRLGKEPDVNLEPEANQKRLTAEDRRAAVRIGGEYRHLLAIGMR